MPTKTITISKPIIVSPEKFTVSYRLVGDTSWTLHGDEDNDPFTLTVPTVGEYEILVEQDECPAFLYGPITILDTPPCECAVVDTANVAIVDIDAVTTVLRIPFIGALPVSPCGWLLVYTNLKTGVASILTFPTLTNPIERVIAKGADYSYTLRVNCCSDVYSYCAQGEVEGSSAIPQCQKIILKDEGTLIEDITAYFIGIFAEDTNGEGYFNIRCVTFPPSLCDRCFVLRVRVTTPVGSTSITVFDQYTQQYCIDDCCVGIGRLEVGEGAEKQVITAYRASTRTDKCGNPILRISSFFTCIDNYTGEYWGLARRIIEGINNPSLEDINFGKVTNIRGLFKRLPREVKTTIALNCQCYNSNLEK